MNEKTQKITYVLLITTIMLLSAGIIYFTIEPNTTLNITQQNNDQTTNPTTQQNTPKPDNNNNDVDQQQNNHDTQQNTPKDTDKDGYPDTQDTFPNDPNEHQDTDQDGIGDNSDAFPYDSSEQYDSDQDGYGDNTDRFPFNPYEHRDSDNDGIGDNSDAFPYDSTEQYDNDNDGIGDNADAFPYDPNEQYDHDNDGVGDNMDPFPYDHDNDGYPDSEDISLTNDLAIKINIQQLYIEDDIDPIFFENGEIYIDITIDNFEHHRISDNGEYLSIPVRETYYINEHFIYNIPDNQRFTPIQIKVIDIDVFDQDQIDIDGSSINSKTLDITYDAETQTWYGDASFDMAAGSEDGTQNTDDDDGTLIFTISNIERTPQKTYTWKYNNRYYTAYLEIPIMKYAEYRTKTIDRSPGTDRQIARQYFTKNDPILQQLAQQLQTLAQQDNHPTADFILQFVQSIEYTHDNETWPVNEYWQFPIETLYDEKGDCEDTSILYGTLIEILNYDAILLIIHPYDPTEGGHAAIGIYTTTEGYTYATYNNRNYAFCETTSIIRSIGDIPEKYKRSLVDLTIIDV